MKNVKSSILFSAIEAKSELEKNIALLSSDKAENAAKNKANRLRKNDKFCKESENVLRFIVDNTDDKAFDQLCLLSCYKTADMIVNAARLLSNDSATVSVTVTRVIERMLRLTKRSADKQRKIAVSEIVENDYSNVSKRVKALALFKVIRFADNRDVKIENNKINMMLSQHDVMTLDFDKLAQSKRYV